MPISEASAHNDNHKSVILRRAVAGATEHRIALRFTQPASEPAAPQRRSVWNMPLIVGVAVPVALADD